MEFIKRETCRILLGAHYNCAVCAAGLLRIYISDCAEEEDQKEIEKMFLNKYGINLWGYIGICGDTEVDETIPSLPCSLQPS